MREQLAIYWRVLLWCAGVGAVVIGIDAVLNAPFKAGVITTITLLGGVNMLVQLFDHKAEQRRTAEAREEAARERGMREAAEALAREEAAKREAAEREAEAAEREVAGMRLRIAELEQRLNGK